MSRYQKNPSSRFKPAQQKLLDRVVGRHWRLLEEGGKADNALLDAVIAAHAHADALERQARKAMKDAAKVPATAPRKIPAKASREEPPVVPAKKPRKRPVEAPVEVAPKPPRKPAKPRAPSLSDEQYQQHLARLREWFTGFEAHDGYRPGTALTAHQKKKIRDLSSHLEAFFTLLRDQPPLQRRDFDTMKEAAIARQYTPEIPYRKDMKSFAFVYVPGGDDSARVWIDANGHMHVREGDIEQVFMPFTPQQLLNPMAVAQDVFAFYPNAISWHARAGNYGVVRNAESAKREDGIDGIHGMLVGLQHKYESHEYNPDDPQSSYWANWMTGVIAYVVHNCKGRGCRDKYRDFVYKLRLQSDKRARRASKRNDLERIRKKGRR